MTDETKHAAIINELAPIFNKLWPELSAPRKARERAQATEALRVLWMKFAAAEMAERLRRGAPCA